MKLIEDIWEKDVPESTMLNEKKDKKLTKNYKFENWLEVIVILVCKWITLGEDKIVK